MVTYIFGAGASIESVPVAEKLQSSINDFISYIKGTTTRVDDDWKISLNDHSLFHAKDYLIKLVKKAETLLSECQYHQTIDTYAKMLYLTKQYEKYIDLKTVLCCYFYWVQNRIPVAKRYDHFIASIIDDINPGNRQSVIPDEIRIISWNYDLQFEMAMSKYLSYCVNCRDVLEFASITTQYCSDFPDYSVIKLNGCCLLDSNKSYHDHFELPTYDVNNYDKISLEKCVAAYYLISENIAKPLLNFAWENRPKIEAHLKNYQKLSVDIFDTEYLVVIGYSFPFFNRQIDRTILNRMTKLKKLYVQCPEGQTLVSKLKSFITKQDVDYIFVEDMSQFFLPPEL